MRVRIAAAVAVVVTSFVVPRGSETARADDSAIDAEAIVNQFIASLDQKKVAKAVEMMNPDVVDAVGAKPAEASRLAKTVVDRFLHICTVDRKNAIPVAEIALRAAKKAASLGAPAAGAAPAGNAPPADGAAAPPEGEPAPAANPPAAGGADEGTRALAFARLGLSATKSALSEPVPPEEWTEPLATMRKIAPTMPTGAEDLKLCIETVWYATDDDAPVEAPLRAAAETATFAAKTFPQVEGIKSLSAQSNLALACGLAWTKPEEGKKALPVALAAIAALGPDAERDKTLVSLWNRGVGEGRRIKVPAFKYAFKVDKAQTANSYFEIEIPKESGWEVAQGGGSTDQLQLVLVRDRGVKGKTNISMWMYKWDTNYIDDEDKRVGGENKGGMMRRRRADNMKEMSKITKDEKQTKTKFSSNFPNVMGCDFRGKDGEGNDARNRIWAFHGDVHKQTYLLDVMQTGAVKEVDPQLEFVLDSLKELGKK